MGIIDRITKFPATEVTRAEREDTMENTFILENTEYIVATCTAVALSAGDEESDRQDALLVTSYGDSGEKFEYVVFGYLMPETIEDFSIMCKDSAAWDSDWETLKTVKR
jgi:hypothetical protein